MLGIKNNRFPNKQEIIPPKQEIEATINKNNQGLFDFDAHAIKASGGIIPKIVSETKKKEDKFWRIIGYKMIKQRIKIQHKEL